MKMTEIGKIVNFFGLKGELKVLPNDNFNLKEHQKFCIEKFDADFECEKITKTNRFTKLKIVGYDDINNIMQFKNKKIYVQTVKEEQDSFVNFAVVDGNRQIGVVLGVENFGASDILVLDMDGKECRVPFVEEFFNSIDKENKVLSIKKSFYEVVV